MLLLLACKDRHGANAGTMATKQLWTCSMHPEIIRDKPGICPICGMDLVKKEENATAIADIRLNDLLRPADNFVISSVPVTAMAKAAPLLEVEALGRVSYDTRLVNTIAARVSGRIERLYIKYRYQHVMKGERVMDIYSPELLAGEQELLFLLKNDPGNISLIRAGKEKLQLLGISEDQLEHVIRSGRPSPTVALYSSYDGHVHEAGGMPGAGSGAQNKNPGEAMEELPIKEGTYVQKGQTIFQVFNTSRSWVLLSIFPEDQKMIKTGEAVRVVAETAPEKSFRGTIDYIEPFYPDAGKTLTIRVYFANDRLGIPIGSQVKATIFAAMGEANWLPGETVLSLGVDQIVFLKEKGGFRARKVETGVHYQNRVQIVSGLASADSVAANAQFLMDSENFIKVNGQP